VVSLSNHGNARTSSAVLRRYRAPAGMTTMTQTTDLAALESALTAEIAAADDLAGIERVRIAALGKKGRVPELMATLGSLPGDQRKAFGQAVNGLKARVTEALEGRKAELERGALSARLASEKADVTLPVRIGPLQDGRIHPVSQVFDEVVEIFADMGFAVAEGPDIETDDYNFTKLNIPPEHPARQEHDTFYMQGSGDTGRNSTIKVLRTHTSPVQIRTMLTQKPPIRIIVPGRVYRLDSDATHTPMFHQIEGLVIDETTHLGHLKWCLEEFCKAFFEVDAVRMRFRASHFPFTEPSMEVDIDAAAIGKPGQWLEILGSGMVHPNVIRNCGLDPGKYQGFAFGMGLDRITMLKYGIPDLRDMFAADLRWLRHYGFTALDVPTLAGGLSP
jgi:phenylalanyl-tRNA synthetase alpha chain